MTKPTIESIGPASLARYATIPMMFQVRTVFAVEPREHGLGGLFDAALEFTRKRACRQLKIETQNINVPACRFYQSLGCVLGAVNCYAYPDLPDEVRLDWYYDLRPAQP